MEKRIGERLGIAEKLGFLCFSMSDNIIYYFKSIYYLIFLTNVLNIPMMMAGIMTAVGTIWDAVNDPLVGVITANRKFRTGETIRPYLKYMSLPWAISMVLLFTDFHLSLMPTVIVSLVVFFFYELENTFSAFLIMRWQMLRQEMTASGAASMRSALWEDVLVLGSEQSR